MDININNNNNDNNNNNNMYIYSSYTGLEHLQVLSNF